MALTALTATPTGRSTSALRLEAPAPPRTTTPARLEEEATLTRTPRSTPATPPRPRLGRDSRGALLFGTPLPLFNGDFELGCGNGWKEYAGTATEDAASPSQGAIACRVCNSGGDSSDGSPDIDVNMRVSPALASQCFLVDDLSLSRIRAASTN